MRLIIAAGLALIAGSASAQTSNTNCYAAGNQLNCTTQQNPGVNWNLGVQQTNPLNSYLQGVERGRAAAVQRQAEQAQMAAAQAYQQDAERQAYDRRLRDRVGAMVAQGRCSDALGIAVSMADMALVQAIQAACKPN